MSSTPIQPEPEDTTDPVVTEAPAPEHIPASAHPDPITGEPGAHPVGVGVGALGAGAAGAAIGAIGGPIGMLIGAAIGAVAGGLAGKEVATSNEEPAVAEESTAMDEPTSTVLSDMPTPISTGSLPGEGFRAMSGAGFAGDAGMLSTGTNETSAGLAESVEDDALPTPSHAAMPGAAGFQAPTIPETTPLAGTPMPQSGEEAVRVSAYYHYLGRSTVGEPGDALSDWLAAEREMMLS